MDSLFLAKIIYISHPPTKRKHVKLDNLFPALNRILFPALNR